MWVRRPKYPLLSLLTLSLPRCHLKTTHESEKFETRKPFWSSFSHWHVKVSPSKRIALKINVTGLENMLLCIIQPGNVTGWDSEGVKWPVYKYIYKPHPQQWQDLASVLPHGPGVSSPLFRTDPLGASCAPALWPAPPVTCALCCERGEALSVPKNESDSWALVSSSNKENKYKQWSKRCEHAAVFQVEMLTEGHNDPPVQKAKG